MDGDLYIYFRAIFFSVGDGTVDFRCPASNALVVNNETLRQDVLSIRTHLYGGMRALVSKLLSTTPSNPLGPDKASSLS